MFLTAFDNTDMLKIVKFGRQNLLHPKVVTTPRRHFWYVLDLGLEVVELVGSLKF